MDDDKILPRPIPVVTTPRYDNYNHVTIGIIHSEAVTQSLQHAMSACLRDLRHQATELGADAVIAVTHSVSHSLAHNNSVTYALTVTGTAVRLPWPLGTATPELLATNPDNLETR
jgi:uncharacterized protein YbjQ (UPF0145 family)